MVIRTLTGAAALLAALPALAAQHGTGGAAIDVGARPHYLVGLLEDGPLNDELSACLGQPASRTAFSIGHRGEPLQFPEHTVEGNRAAARMGAGLLECDVTFTADKALVCRHAQDDLATTTDILTTDLASKCTRGFTPAEGGTELWPEMGDAL